MQPDIGETARRDGGQRLGHAVDERLDADEAGARMLLGFRDQMLAAAESDLEAHRLDGVREQHRRIGRRGICEVERKARQQRVEQGRLLRPKLVAFAPAEEGARLAWRVEG